MVAFAGLLAGLLGKVAVAQHHGLLVGAAEQIGHDAVDGQIRVAADGAGEVGIVLQHQTIVALGLFFVAGLGHAAEHAGIDDLFKCRAAHPFQNGAQLLGGGHLLGKVVVDAAGLQQCMQALQLFAVGFLVDTVDEGDLLDAGKVGRALVGQQHELLDHGLALAGGALLDVDAVAVLVEDELHFPALEVDAAALGAQAGTVGGSKVRAFFTIKNLNGVPRDCYLRVKLLDENQAVVLSTRVDQLTEIDGFSETEIPILLSVPAQLAPGCYQVKLEITSDEAETQNCPVNDIHDQDAAYIEVVKGEDLIWAFF